MNWYTIKQVAEKLARSEGWVRRECKKLKAGRFPNALKDGDWRIPQCDLEAYGGVAVVPDDDIDAMQVETARMEAEAKKIAAEIKLVEVKGERDKPAVLVAWEADLKKREATLVRALEESGDIITAQRKLRDAQIDLDKKEETLIHNGNEFIGLIKDWLAGDNKKKAEIVKELKSFVEGKTSE